jgi:hypothetical protein
MMMVTERFNSSSCCRISYSPKRAINKFGRSKIHCRHKLASSAEGSSSRGGEFLEFALAKDKFVAGVNEFT